MEKRNEASESTVGELTPEQVAEFLRQNPDFLMRHPELLATLTPPQRQQGEGVVDMQGYFIDRLQRELGGMQRDQEALLATSRGNLTSQARIHEAVLDILNANSFERFVDTLTTDLAVKLDIDLVSLCVEQETPPVNHTRTGVRFLTPGSVDNLMYGERILLRPISNAERAIYGYSGRALVRSDAILRLEVSNKAPLGLIALGSRVEGHFTPNQGTELLGFLGQVIESTARAWLELPV